MASGQSPPVQTGPGWARTTAGAAAGQVQRGHAGRRRARARGGGRLSQAQPAAVVVREGRAAARRGRTALGMCMRTVHVPGDVVSSWQRPLLTWHSMYWENWSCMRTRAGAAEAETASTGLHTAIFGVHGHAHALTRGMQYAESMPRFVTTCGPGVPGHRRCAGGLGGQAATIIRSSRAWQARLRPASLGEYAKLRRASSPAIQPALGPYGLPTPMPPCATPGAPPAAPPARCSAPARAPAHADA